MVLLVHDRCGRGCRCRRRVINIVMVMLLLMLHAVLLRLLR